MPRFSYSLVMGPMFAGKTSSLIEDFHQAQGSGRNVLVLAPSIDTRHSGNGIVSHTGQIVKPVFRIGDSRGLLSALSRLPRHQDCTILVDECQFFDVSFTEDFLESLMFLLADRDTHIHIGFYGLDNDARCRPWPMTDRIRLLPEIVVRKITARCSVCGSPAIYTDRVNAGDVVQIGGKETYFPVCHKHHHLHSGAAAVPAQALEQVA